MTRLAPFATSNRSDNLHDLKLQTHINTSNNIVLCKGAWGGEGGACDLAVL